MTEFLTILSLVYFILICALWSKFSNMKRYMAALKKRLDILENGDKTAVAPEKATSTLPQQKSDLKTSKTEDGHNSETTSTLNKEKSEKSPTKSVAKTSTPPAQVVKEPVEKESKSLKSAPVKKEMGKWERFFIESWTGILGAIIFVTGITFLGIYAAFKMSPFYRFCLIVLTSLVLYILSYFLSKKDMWLKLSNWIKSCASAIFLFATLAAGHINTIKWIDNYYLSIGLLSLGVMVNLFLGSISKKEYFASLHVALSLVSLAIVNQSFVTLIISAIVVLFGIFQTYKSRWQYHFLLTIFSFLAFHIFWNYSFFMYRFIENLNFYRFSAIIICLLVGCSALFVHYKKIYSEKNFNPLDLIVHVLNWVLLASNLLIYSRGLKVDTILLAVASILVFLLSRYAKRLNIKWLHSCDTIMAQLLMLFSLYTLTRWGLNSFSIMVMAAIEFLIILYLLSKEKGADGLLSRVFAIGHHMVLLTLIIMAMNLTNQDNILGVSYMYGLLSGFLVVVEIIFHYIVYSGKREKMDSLFIYGLSTAKVDSDDYYGLSPILTGILTLFVYIFMKDITYMNYGFSIFFALILLSQKKIKTNGMAVGSLVSLVIVHMAAWSFAGDSSRGDSLARGLYLAPFLPLSIISMRTTYLKTLKRYLAFPGVYLFSLTIFYMLYLSFNSISTLIPGVSWLILSVIFLELSRFISKKSGDKNREMGSPDIYIFHMAIFSLVLFLIRHFVRYMSVDSYLGVFPLRVVLTLFALMVFLYWVSAEKPVVNGDNFCWKYIHPLFWEISILFGLFTLPLDIHSRWIACAWVLLALGLLLMGKNLSKKFSRLSFYSILCLWGSNFYLAFISLNRETPDIYLADKTWIGGLIAVFLSFLYVYIFYRGTNLKDIHFPTGFGWLKPVVAIVDRFRNRFIYYPIFIVVGLFLYWTFSSSLLTLLWVIESFAIFILSIMFKDKQFRYAAYSIIIFCLFRLVFFDLSQSATPVRALVFLGFGAILLVINSLYIKFKDRF